MSKINIRNLCNENEDGAPTIVGVSTFSATSYMCPPKGTTAQRPSNPVSGSLRFNTDTASLEYYRGDTLNWTQIEMTSPDLDGGVRGITASGNGTPSNTSTGMEYHTISTLGNGTDFGDLEQGRRALAAASSRTRLVTAGGYGPATTDKMEYHTISTTGETGIDFGNLSTSRYGLIGLSNQIRAIYACGEGASKVDYVTIASTGHAQNFDATDGGVHKMSCSSSTRGLFVGWESPASGGSNAITMLTITTTGTISDFGEATDKGGSGGSGSNSVRGVFMGRFGSGDPAASDVIDYVTIATTGNALDFGDLDADNDTHRSSGCASATRLLKCGGTANPGGTNIICYIEIATTGNALDFGDLNEVCSNNASASNGHGGL